MRIRRVERLNWKAIATGLVSGRKILIRVNEFEERNSSWNWNIWEDYWWIEWTNSKFSLGFNSRYGATTKITHWVEVERRGS